ncbi:DUF3524 domain-containing protein [Aliikangiella marina]|uniref:tRNA-queuosine alpha-mannosyltransferase n=1 Tax=Aliikangiella marina TaxID=1712262 RepID=A0A545TDS7_9GAMM|nr:DUF3524 domain-containing protein [Aliikangiella marina]TQV75372.1 DUF3524 domain-containing protein [Aliikangiella marina]
MNKPKILLISGYDAASHRHWQECLASVLDGFEWTQIALPARNFSWRVRGSALNLYAEYSQQLADDYDLTIATSMVDLAALRGLVPKVSQVPNILYFHENQFVYPISKDQPNILNAQLSSLYSALSADEVWFNSEYNRQSFVQGARTLLKKLPDRFDGKLLEGLTARSRILPVPLKLSPSAHIPLKTVANPPHILWNHRWEYDKQPEVFFEALQRLKQNGTAFEVSVVGESFREIPPCFEVAKQQLSAEILNWGYQPREKYLQILAQADLVVSSAIHDFQGLSVLEAIGQHCLPIAPNRLVYPEYIPANYLYEVGDNSCSESEQLARHLMTHINSKDFQPIDINRFYLQDLMPKYRQRILELISSA